MKNIKRGLGVVFFPIFRFSERFVINRNKIASSVSDIRSLLSLFITYLSQLYGKFFTDRPEKIDFASIAVDLSNESRFQYDWLKDKNPAFYSNKPETSSNRYIGVFDIFGTAKDLLK